MGRLEQTNNRGSDIAAVAIIISGRPGSGKTTLANQLAEVLSVPSASFGHVVRAVAADRYGAQPTAADLEDVGTALIEAGWVRFCTMLLGQIPAGAEVFVIDGVRHLQATRTLHTLTSRRPVWLFVEADPQVLATRLAGRHPSRMRYEDSDMERAAERLIDHADLVVPSPWDLDIVTSDVRRLLSERTIEGP